MPPLSPVFFLSVVRCYFYGVILRLTVFFFICLLFIRLRPSALGADLLFFVENLCVFVTPVLLKDLDFCKQK